jgi:hypothetical protein
MARFLGAGWLICDAGKMRDFYFYRRERFLSASISCEGPEENLFSMCTFMSVTVLPQIAATSLGNHTGWPYVNMMKFLICIRNGVIIDRF